MDGATPPLVTVVVMLDVDVDVDVDGSLSVVLLSLELVVVVVLPVVVESVDEKEVVAEVREVVVEGVEIVVFEQAISLLGRRVLIQTCAGAGGPGSRIGGNPSLLFVSANCTT